MRSLTVMLIAFGANFSLAAAAVAQVPAPLPGRQPQVIDLPAEEVEQEIRRQQDQRRDLQVPFGPLVMAPTGTARGIATGEGKEIVWRTGAVFAGGSAPARHFAICIRPSPTAACTWPGDFRMPVTALSGEPYTINRRRVRGSDVYRFPLAGRFNTNWLNRDMAISVGACAAEETSACTFSPWHRIYWSTRNLSRPSLANADLNTPLGEQTTARFTVRAHNDGDVHTGPFMVQADFYEVRFDQAMNNGCLLDVNAASVQASDLVIFADGRAIPAGSLPRDRRGRRIAENVVGIAPSSSNHLRLVNQRERSLGIMVWPDWRPAAEFAVPFSWAQYPQSPKPIVAIMMLDVDNEVREYDETDNVAAGCLRRALLRN